MKHKYFILTFMALIAGSVITGCDSNREKRVEDAKENVKQANQDLKDAQSDSISEWQQFKNDAEVKINANGKRITEFKLKIKSTGKEIKVKYEREITVLEQKNVELKKKMNEYKFEGKDKWIEFKKGFNHDINVVGKALDDLFTKKD